MRRVLVALALVAMAGCASAGDSAGRLHRIVAECLDTSHPAYCARCPAPQAGTCQLDYPCSRTTEVWAMNREYVAIRDVKMCGCGDGFVHGLALPRFTVAGPEDPRRPDGIWPFAWDAARQRIPVESEIALVVNSPQVRTQDQLHVHLVRLLPGARSQLSTLEPVAVTRLEESWPAAAQHAATRQLTSYGVIVVLAPEGGWLVAAVEGSPEITFTRGRCTS